MPRHRARRPRSSRHESTTNPDSACSRGRSFIGDRRSMRPGWFVHGPHGDRPAYARTQTNCTCCVITRLRPRRVLRRGGRGRHRQRRLADADERRLARRYGRRRLARNRAGLRRTLPPRDHPPGPTPQLLDHRPHRSRQVDPRRSPARADPHDRGPPDDEPGPRFDGPRAREGDHDQGPGRPPRVHRPQRPELRPQPHRHARATSTSPTR